MIKIYKKNSYYHIYNRGVEKRDIFLDEEDYVRFLRFIRDSGIKKDVDFLCYCFMPNHFHFLVYQRGKRDIEKLMRSLMTKYSMYFNNKYDRVGKLFQGIYRARIIRSDEDLINVSAYIHNNYRKEHPRMFPENYKYSSFSLYLEENYSGWVKVGTVKSYFSVNSYKKLVDVRLNKRVDLG